VCPFESHMLLASWWLYKVDVKQTVDFG
jgi:hypothetical protein